jgi:hypothetical protein
VLHLLSIVLVGFLTAQEQNGGTPAGSPPAWAFPFRLWSDLMKGAVEKLTEDDLIAINAYAGSQMP